MNIKQIILGGGKVSFPYKYSEKSWVGDAKISMLDAIAWGIAKKNTIEIQTPMHRKEYEMNDIDKAIDDFKKIVFSPKNLHYKFDEAIRTLLSEGVADYLDPDNPKDLKQIRKKQKELLCKN